MSSSILANAEVCRALGLDPNVTARILIVLDAKEPARVYVRQYLLERAEPLLKVVRRFKVTELGAEES